MMWPLAPRGARLAEPENRPSLVEASETVSAWHWIALVILVVATAAIRWRLLDVPLDRDEGEFAYMAQQFLRGVPPYVSGYAMKMPGIYLAYALVLLVFGETIRGVHLGLLVVNLATVVVLFLLARRLYGPLVGLLSAGAYAFLSLVPGVHGSAAQAEHFVNLPVLGGMLLLLAALDEPAAGEASLGSAGRLVRLAGGGFLLGLAMIIKQHSAPFVLLGGGLLLTRTWGAAPRSQIAPRCVFVATAALPLAAVLVVEWQLGLFEQFWFWTIDYASKYAALVPPRVALGLFEESAGRIVDQTPLFWIMGTCGLAALVWDDRAKQHRGLMFAWLVASLASILPGLHFFPHAFVLLLPATSLLVGLGCVAVGSLVSHWVRALRPAPVVLALAVAVLASSVWHERAYLFRLSPRMLSYEVYGVNPFSEAVEVAHYISAHSRQGDKLLVCGSEPEIYFYTGLRAATGHIYVYPLMERQPYARQMQEELIAEVERAQPEHLVLVNFEASWLQFPDSEKKVLDWFPGFLRDQYEMTGIADMVSPEHAEIIWGDPAASYRPHSGNWLAVFRRK